jgi:uncharacterized protein
MITASAVVVTSLYSVQQDVNSKSLKDRNRALVRAMRKVLIKVSGNAKVIKQHDIANTVYSASSYVQEYSYQKITDKEKARLTIQVNFSPDAINQLLMKAKQPLWPKDRPLTLIWLVVRDAEGLHFVSSSVDAGDSIYDLLQQDADNRGLPILFPILDLVDLQQVSAEVVGAPFVSIIQQASQRYAPDNILIIKVDATDKKAISSHWTLVLNNEQLSWDTNGSSIDKIIQSGVYDVADAMATRFAAVENPSAQNEVKLIVTGLNSLDDYAKISQYLNGLPGVKNVQVLNISPDKLDFSLILTSSLVSLQQNIGLGSMLKPNESDEINDQAEKPILRYRLKN